MTVMTIEQAKEKYPNYDKNLPWFTTDVGQSFTVDSTLVEGVYKSKSWGTVIAFVGLHGYRYHKTEGEDGSLTFTRYE